MDSLGEDSHEAFELCLKRGVRYHLEDGERKERILWLEEKHDKMRQREINIYCVCRTSSS